MTERHKPDGSRMLFDSPAGPLGGDGEIPEDPRIIEVVQEYLVRLEKGEVPDRATYIQRYPELAGAIKDCLEGLEMVHAASQKKQAQSADTGPGPASAVPGEALPDPLGDFRIVRELARGGMGVVYEAVQLSLARRVALKVLPFAATLDTRQLQRFKTEAQAAALLHHTNIVPVYAVGCERGVHFYAMQLIEGQSLAALIVQLRRQAGLPTPDDVASRGAVASSYVLGTDPPTGSSALSRHGRPPAAPSPAPETTSQFHAQLSTQHAGRDSRFFRTAVRLMLQAAQALEHAHEFGIVHRDIKPANLLLDMNGVLWVADFGLAQFHADSGLTRTGDIPGTLRYMSPEQASGQRAVLDRRTDVYSLGATFYELLTLEPIFKGRDVQYLLHQVLHAEPRPLRQVDKTIPGELETIILKSVSKSPEERYRTAGELAADLQRYLDHEPIHARRPSLVDRVRKWSRRHPSVVVSGMLLLAVISIALFISNRREQLRADELQKSSQREQFRANEAEAQYQQARRIVDVLVEVSEEELADNWAMQGWAMQGARQKLLGIALGFYQDVIDQRPGDAASLTAVQERVKGLLHEMAVMKREMHRGALENAAVRNALELTEEQQGAMTKLLETWKDERESVMKEIWDLSEDARRRRMVVIAEDHDQKLNRLLTGKQSQRLTEIVIQFAGIFAFKDPEIVKVLELKPEQRKAIREIEREMFRRAPGPPGPGRGPEGMRGGPPRVTKREAVAKVLASLTEDQVKKWNDLTGPEFAGVDEPVFPGMPGGPPHERRGPPGERRREPPQERGDGRPSSP